MKKLALFWNWLTSSSEKKLRKGHPDLYPIDVQKIAKELNLLEEAKRLGEAGIPKTDSKSLTGPERLILQRVEKSRQDYVDWAVIRLNVLSQNIGKMNIKQDINHALKADKEFELEASNLLSERENMLRSLGVTAQNNTNELINFKKKNNLRREAVYPTNTGSFLRYMILVFLIVIEGCLNSVFFAQGLDTGLLGGFLNAAILATINVVIAFCLGKFLIPYIYHSKTTFKLIGILAIIVAISIITGIGLGIAHYRDSLTSGISNPAKIAYEAMQSNLFQLKDLFSWILFLISALFGSLSLTDGLLSDDKYPGYGSITRRYLLSVEDYETELDDLRSQLEELKEEKLKFLENIAQKSQASIGRLQEYIEDKKMAGSRLLTALRDADHSLHALLWQFRTENAVHRKSLPAPKYFDSKPDLLPIQIPSFDTLQDEQILDDQKELLKLLIEEIQDIRARIQASFSNQFDRLKPLNAHFYSKEVS